MIGLKRTDSSDDDFLGLVRALDRELSIRDGADHAFYAQFNKVDHIKYALIAYWSGKPVGCGAIKPFDDQSMEVKRMYVDPDFRGKGIATTILVELENWAGELHYSRCVLETGKRQPEAISLYEKSGYSVIPNYGQYKGVENSVCFEKALL